MYRSLYTYSRCPTFGVNRTIESEITLDGRYGKVQDFAIRYSSLVLRIALQLSILEEQQKIGGVEITNAITLMRYFMTSAERCFMAMQEAKIPDGARRIIKLWQKETDSVGRPFSIRQIENKLGMLKPEVDEALKFLVEHHYCRYLPMARTPGRAGRSASPLLEVNPQFYE